ncbi:MAG TPA: hypothetical protein DDY93_17005 [Dehalococcoidia bacterium]|nr:hypothetical protein [Dehalococcoidia bacterium]HBJ33052.1 hypothetical protein [Dehalococcoidia bacterium]HIM91100.1 hypothetical protein [Dehalococcoidia bacterium]
MSCGRAVDFLQPTASCQLRLRYSRRQEVDLSLGGIFEVRDGKIRHWRDYFDLATYQGAFPTK